jgi:hypothetical protein
MTISLSFLAPDLVNASIEGQLPRGIGVTRLCDLSVEWSRQYRMLGLPKSWLNGLAQLVRTHSLRIATFLMSAAIKCFDARIHTTAYDGAAPTLARAV